MKKIGLLLVTTIFLSGCSATSGILTREDVIEAGKGNSKEIIEKQKEVSYVPEDVKEFIGQIKEANDNFDDTSYNYSNMILDNTNFMEEGKFLKELYISNNADGDSTEEFKKIVNILDKTIAKGIKLYLDKNIDADLEDSGVSTRLGRAWVSIRPVEILDERHDYIEQNMDAAEDFRSEFAKNEVSIVLKLKDIKDPKYKKIVESIEDENLVTDSIHIGKHQDLITLSNINSKYYEGYDQNQFETAINYSLFMKDKNINKVRMSVSAIANEDINNDLQSLTRVANALEFATQDMKKLEELKIMIKENSIGKKTLSSEHFNFSYRNSEREVHSYDDGSVEKINTAEVVIEKRN